MGNKDCRLTVGKGYGFLRPDGGKPAELERATYGRESGPIVRFCHSGSHIPFPCRLWLLLVFGTVRES